MPKSGKCTSKSLPSSQAGGLKLHRHTDLIIKVEGHLRVSRQRNGQIVEVLPFWASWLRLGGGSSWWMCFPDWLRLQWPIPAGRQPDKERRSALAAWLKGRADVLWTGWLVLTWEVELGCCDGPARRPLGAQLHPKSYLSQHLSLAELWSERSRLYRPDALFLFPVWRWRESWAVVKSLKITSRENAWEQEI